MKPNLNIPDPSLYDVLEQFKKNIFIDLKCHAIGTIENFDPATQLSTVKIAYSKTVYQNLVNGEQKKTLVPYPLLSECPTVVLGGGNAGMTMPIKTGDQCLVLFNDRNIDNWLNGKSSGELADSRLHAFADAIALVGIRSLDKVIENYDAENPVIYNGDTKVTVKADKLRLENAQYQLGALLAELVDVIKGIQVLDTGTSANPAGVWSLAPASGPQLDAIKSKLQGLLE